MPFPDHVFHNVPALQGLIVAPDKSGMRLGLERFDELDRQAAAEGWEAGWRLEHDAREANRREVLRNRLHRDLWVFAYGSLIWDPAVYLDEYRYGTLSGWHRSFCMRILGSRATRDRPGLMAALEPGGDCHGVVFRISAGLVDQETEFMWRREMFSGAYRPVFETVITPQGSIEALVFVINPDAEAYLPDLPEEQAATMIAAAEGDNGSNLAYLEVLVHRFECLGIEDPAISRLHQQAASLRV